MAGDKRYNVFDQDHDLPSFQEQVNWFRKEIRPIKSKILGILEGNHEEKIKKRLGYDFTAWLAEDLNTEYLHQISLLRLDCGFRTLRSLDVHGTGAPMTVGGQIAKLKRLMQNFEFPPDIISVGHWHRLDSVKFPVLDDDLKSKIKHFGFTGSFFRTYVNGTSNYASDRWLQPNLLGYLIYTITSDGGIECKERIFP